jgi:uncharacterized protein (DUF2236 family)
MVTRSTTSSTGTRPGPVGQGGGTSAQTDPLGPDSLTWKYFGDLRT